MISRDRFEVILESISKGTAIENARNRLEMIFSAIAEKIGTGGGGGGGGSTITREVIGEYESPSTQLTYIETTKPMSDYDYLEIEFEVTTTYASVSHVTHNYEVVYYEEGKCGRTIVSTTSSSAGLFPIMWEYTNPSKISLVYGYASALNIKKITGIKLDSEA